MRINFKVWAPLCLSLWGLGCGAAPESTGGTESEQVTPSEGDPLGVTEAPLSTNSPYVGLIPVADLNDSSTAACAPGVTLAGVRMDDEDGSDNNDQLVVGSQDYSHHNAAIGGLGHSSSPWRAGANSWIKYCPTPMATLPRLSADYAVISASNVCPANSYRFARRWDNEDGSPHNAVVGDFSPNSTSNNGGATWIYFCFVPALAGAPSWNSGFDNSLIFSNGPLTNKGRFRTDDEDNDNHNGYWVAADAAVYTSRMQALVSSGSNTNLLFATNSAVTVTDLGTATDCAASNYKVGFSCSYTSNGQFAGCKVKGDVGDWWDFAKDMFCRW